MAEYKEYIIDLLKEREIIALRGMSSVSNAMDKIRMIEKGILNEEEYPAVDTKTISRSIEENLVMVNTECNNDEKLKELYIKMFRALRNEDYAECGRIKSLILSY